MNATWDFFLDWVPLVDHVMFPSFAALGSFYVTCVAFTLFDIWLQRPGLWEFLKDCALVQIKWHVILNGIGWILVGGSNARVELPENAPTIQRFLGEVVACFIVGDLLIYWEHVVMHGPSWVPLPNRIRQTLRGIHQTHHEHTTLFSWAAGWVHPVEISVAIACEGAFPVLYGVHPMSRMVFIISWVFWLVEEHSGHHVWWSLYRLLPYVGGGSCPHDLHHSPYTTKNFAFVFSGFDRLFGTFEDPEVFAQDKRKKRA